MDGTIHLVRHGEVENPKGVIYGRLPGFNLSERGRRQAQAAAEHLAERAIGAVWTSPLERARETADQVAARHGLEPVIDDRLLESDTTLEGVGRSVGQLLRSPRTWWNLRNPWRPSWGETYREIRKRVLAAIEDALARNAGGDVAVVSHQTPILVARLSLSKSRTPPWGGLVPCSTGSVTSIVLEDGRVTSLNYFSP